MSLSRRLVLAGAMLLVGIASMPLVPHASAAAPRVIAVEGELLDSPVLLRDWAENLDLVQAIEGGRGAVPASWDPSKAARPRLDLLYFWTAEPAVTSVSQLGSPEARIAFWPAVGSEPARTGMGEIADARVLAILERHGVPTRVAERAPDAGPGWPVSDVAVGASVVVALLVSLAAYRRARS